MTRLLDLFRTRCAKVGGSVSAIVLDAESTEVLAVEPDEPMPAASVIKLPLVMTLFADAAEGRIDLEQRLGVGPRVAGSGVLRDLSSVSELSLRDLAALAMMVSDNGATNRIIDRLGIERVNERLDEWGCRATRLQRAMFDTSAKARGLMNVMTARETASLLHRVIVGAVAGDAACAAVLALLERNSDLTRLGRYLTPAVSLAHKDGWDDDPRVDNDAGIVRAAPATAASGSAAASEAVIAVGFAHGIDPLTARPLLGLLGLAAAELAGADLGSLPSEVSSSA